MYIGEIIKSYREQHNMTVEEFANKSNLSQTEINQLEELFQKRWNDTSSCCNATN